MLVPSREKVPEKSSKRMKVRPLLRKVSWEMQIRNASFNFFLSENKNLSKNLHSLISAYYHLCKNLLRVTWENAGSNSRLFYYVYNWSFVSYIL